MKITPSSTGARSERAEQAPATAERKAKLEARIDALRATLKHKTEEARARREALRSQAEAKIDVLKAKLARARGNMKNRHKKHLASARKEFDKTAEQLDEQRAR